MADLFDCVSRAGAWSLMSVCCRCHHGRSPHHHRIPHDRDDNACALHRRKIYSPSWRHSARTAANECRSKVIDRRMYDAQHARMAVFTRQLSTNANGFRTASTATNDAALYLLPVRRIASVCRFVPAMLRQKGPHVSLSPENRRHRVSSALIEALGDAPG